MPPERIYWDANCFLSYVNGIEDRLPVLDALLDRAERSEVLVVTSMISLTEVAYAAYEKELGRLDATAEAAIDALFDDRSVVALVEYHEFVARQARGLMREAIAQGWSLRPADAIHLASAKVGEATRVHTYDERLFRFGVLLDIPVERPSGANLRLDLDIPHE